MPTPQIGDTVLVSKDTFKITALTQNERKEIEACKVAGYTRNEHVAFDVLNLKPAGPGHWKAESYWKRDYQAT